MRVRAVTKMYYSRREYQPGDTYDMDDREESEAKILHALGKIEIIDLPGKTPKYQTRALEPEQQQHQEQHQLEQQQSATEVSPMTTETAAPLTPPGPGPRYRRRDMRPQS